MNEITNHAELTVERKKEGAYKRDRTLMMLTYWLFLPIVIIAVLIPFQFQAFLFVIIPVYPFLISKVIKPATWYLVDQEYRMDISGGTLSLYQIFGKNTEVGKRDSMRLAEVKVSQLEAIAPYNGGSERFGEEGTGISDEEKARYKELARKEIAAYDPEVSIEAVSTMSHPDVYYVLFVDENERKTVAYFEATDKALKVCKFLNNKTVVVPVSR